MYHYQIWFTCNLWGLDSPTVFATFPLFDSVQTSHTYSTHHVHFLNFQVFFWKKRRFFYIIFVFFWFRYRKCCLIWLKFYAHLLFVITQWLFFFLSVFPHIFRQKLTKCHGKLTLIDIFRFFFLCFSLPYSHSIWFKFCTHQFLESFFFNFQISFEILFCVMLSSCSPIRLKLCAHLLLFNTYVVSLFFAFRIIFRQNFGKLRFFVIFGHFSLLRFTSLLPYY